jgi:peptidyl-prolyl cis-trans isomerase SurA
VRKLFAPLVAGAALLGSAGTAHATIVERVVAVVGERPLLWTEMLHRATATRLQIRAQTRDPNVVAVQEQEMYRELLQRMIDDRLEEQQADKAHVTVTPDEIDRGIANIAAQAQAQQGRAVTPQQVLEEVMRRGLTLEEFRDEIRRQIMVGKLIELRVRPRVRVTEQDARSAYQHWVQEVRAQNPVDARVLALRVMAGSTPAQAQARRQLADTLAKEAQSGQADFCTLVTQYSDDVSTRTTCGSHGAQPLNELMQPIQQVVRTIPAGSVSDPIPVRLGDEEAIIIVMPMPQAKVPSYDDVKSEMMQRALLEGLERARKQWIEELRHNVYIDVRL